ncbi:immunity 22 family protein [Gorillibacterium massiliense]|uniref:immunity 22 family protein n=1 Tax=Gorillibacterium massiliense TaxID=1280390 RepID=UPI0004BC9202|nr:immunity 22 family protein [Gorillibacterium massiliense]
MGESAGAVSLWFGNCRRQNDLNKYVEIKYDEHGDRVRSMFMSDFNLDFLDYNQDLLECTFRETSSSTISELLMNASFSEVIIRELVEFYGDDLAEEYNIAIRLYDYEYEDDIEEAFLDSRKLTYIGSVVYED